MVSTIRLRSSNLHCRSSVWPKVAAAGIWPRPCLAGKPLTAIWATMFHSDHRVSLQKSESSINPSSHSIQTLCVGVERCTAQVAAAGHSWYLVSGSGGGGLGGERVFPNSIPWPQDTWITSVVRLCGITRAHKMFRVKWNLDATPENKKRKVFMRRRRNIKKFPDKILWDESSRALQTGCRKPAPPGGATSTPRGFDTDSIISGASLRRSKSGGPDG